MINKETFKDIPGWSGLYKISNLGNVWSVKRNKPLKPFPRGKGYLGIFLFRNGDRTVYYIHQLVYMTWIGPLTKDRKYSIDHIDSNKKNNSVKNLRLVTHRENCKLNGYLIWGDKKTSRFTNVSKKGNKWLASTHLNGKKVFIGMYDDEFSALKNYDEFMRRNANV
jgi:hypothetical protein